MKKNKKPWSSYEEVLEAESLRNGRYLFPSRREVLLSMKRNGFAIDPAMIPKPSKAIVVDDRGRGRRHAGRIAVLLDREATPAVRELAKQEGRSLNNMASRAVVEYGRAK